jgi:DNA-binding NtrC family response regulator
LSWRHGFRPDALPSRFGPQRWFASVQAPAEAPRRASRSTPPSAETAPRLQHRRSRPCTTQPSSFPPRPRADAEGGDVLGNAECDALRRTLEACRWNISATAVRLRLSRRTIYRKMYRHGIARHDNDELGDK